jgi:dienelactone hydrolase
MRASAIVSTILMAWVAGGSANGAQPAAAASQPAEHVRTLHEGAGFVPPVSKGAWEQRRKDLRTQVLVAAGLWPLPTKGPLNAVIHGKIDRPDYTIEKVYFESYPGFYVTGNLYRSKNKTGPLPAVLCPHGHWNNGRLYEAPDNEVQSQLSHGWEKDPEAARYPMQARCAALAKLGCIVFFYDMIGYADADPNHFPHRQIYRDSDSDLHGLSVFGLQTWDSIRSIDFLQSLPEVDKTRIAITGASGGASQTIMMMAVDDRLAVAAPVNMISAGEHQGGCVCENNSLLRTGTDNVELAATFAPKPFIHPTATGDWTKDYLEHGFPEVQATYELMGAAGKVESMRQTAPHNYNLHAREAVYNFFNQHLKLGHDGVITEPKFTPVPPSDLHVWNAEHPRPGNAVDEAGLKTWWVQMTARQMEALKPRDAESLKQFRAIMEPAVRNMVATGMPSPDALVIESTGESVKDGMTVRKFKVRRKSDHRFIPATLCVPKDASGITLYVNEGIRAGGFPRDEADSSDAMRLLSAGQMVIVADLYGVGDAAHPDVAATRPVEFLTGYNRTMLAEQVHDLLTLIAFCKTVGEHRPVNLCSYSSTGQACLLAGALAGDAISHTVILSAVGDFTAADSAAGEHGLPHSLRYGGLWPIVALCAPGDLTLQGKAPASEWLIAAYQAAGASEKLHIENDPKPGDLIHWLRR